MPRKRLMLVALAAVALAGLAAGLLVARGSASVRVKSGLIASGSFHSVSWGTRGSASIVGKDGRAVLQLRNFQTQKAPELWIVLQKGPDVTSRVQLTHLNRAWGSQDYDVPASFAAHPPERVLIFCSKCGKVWGYAPLQTVRRA
jgi:Electron transfer DM13